MGLPGALAPISLGLFGPGTQRPVSWEVTNMVMTHQLAVNIVYLGLSIYLGCNAYCRPRVWLLGLVSGSAIVMGLRWAGELFPMARWWTLQDLAENILLGGLLLFVVFWHDLSQPRNLQAWASWQPLLVANLLLQQNQLRLCNIIHVKLVWQGVLVWPVLLLSSARPIKFCVYARTQRLPGATRHISLQILALVACITPFIVSLQTLQPYVFVLPAACVPLVIFMRRRAQRNALLPTLIVTNSIYVYASYWLLLCLPVPYVACHRDLVHILLVLIWLNIWLAHDLCLLPAQLPPVYVFWLLL